jgi:hypothetical protein
MDEASLIEHAATAETTPADTPLLRRVRAGVVGDDLVLPGPDGPRRFT